ncbi:hypothetical protein [Actinoplanes sp. L3-i22]|uniref:CG0192-related protein n=1 Tax=Actinoplanes sp. L3-i22 TaxID=2836373 RepID=UPI001C753E10|nr:hypothetical protein [Actinoplanes sp. L3-i22]BCY07557.1 hypothetical protein L3i22_026450 [Actinoplanes sp. L3-i22]
MALLHKTEIRPGKLELLSGWLPAQSWYSGPSEPEVSRVGAARFDDPAGEVGLEIILVRVGDGPVLNVPLTYRGAPLDGAAEFLVGTMEHGVLGPRWVYDAAGDPIFAQVLADAIRNGERQAVEEVHGGGTVFVREPDLQLRGSGSGATDASVVELSRTPQAVPAPGEAVLTGQWAGLDAPIVLARLIP